MIDLKTYLTSLKRFPTCIFLRLLKQKTTDSNPVVTNPERGVIRALLAESMQFLAVYSAERVHANWPCKWVLLGYPSSGKIPKNEVKIPDLLHPLHNQAYDHHSNPLFFMKWLLILCNQGPFSLFQPSNIFRIMLRFWGNLIFISKHFCTLQLTQFLITFLLRYSS